MNKTNEDDISDVHYVDVCRHPALRDHLSVYVINPLEDPSAEEVEDHLLDCRHCRKLFLTMLNLRNGARGTKNMRRSENGRESNEAQVFRLAEFRKEWP
jgi:hypothetical protein